VPSQQPTLIAQISDLHIKRPGERVAGRVDTAAALQRCIAELNRLRPRPALVVISGDICDTPSAEEYDHARRLLEALEIPFVLTAGNHDDRAQLRAAFPQADAAGTDAINLVRSVGELDVVIADTSVPRAAHGFLEADTLHWLDATLSSAPDRPALLFMHHPPFVAGIAHMDANNLRNAGELGAIAGRHKRLQLIATGHLHRAISTSFAGIQTTVCPAPNHAIALDLEDRLPLSFQIEPPAFHLHVHFADAGFGTVVTHLIPIGDFDGPHPFR
jgi:3',5'-cyclic AMP phosphodiesterase CpdA